MAEETLLTPEEVPLSMAGKNFLHKRPKKLRGGRPLTSPAVRQTPSMQQQLQQQQQLRRLDAVLRPLEALQRLERRLEASKGCQTTELPRPEPPPQPLRPLPSLAFDLHEKVRGLRFRHADYCGWERQRPQLPQRTPAEVAADCSGRGRQGLPPSTSPLSPPPPPPSQLPVPTLPPATRQLELRQLGRCKTCFIPLLRDPPPDCRDIMSLLNGTDPNGRDKSDEAGIVFRRPFPLPTSLASGVESIR